MRRARLLVGEGLGRAHRHPPPGCCWTSSLFRTGASMRNDALDSRRGTGVPGGPWGRRSSAAPLAACPLALAVGAVRRSGRWRATSSTPPRTRRRTAAVRPGSVQRAGHAERPRLRQRRARRRGRDGGTSVHATSTTSAFGLFGFPSQLHADDRASTWRRPDTRASRRSPASTPRAPGSSSAAAPTCRSRSSTPGSSGTATACAPRSTSTRASCRCRPRRRRRLDPQPGELPTCERLRLQRRRRLQRRSTTPATRASAPAAARTATPSALDAEDLIAAFTDGTDADAQRLRRRHRRLGLLRQRQRPLRRLELLRRREPRHRPRRGRGRAGQRRRRAASASARTARSCRSAIWDTFVSDGNNFAHGDPLRDRQRRRR